MTQDEPIEIQSTNTSETLGVTPRYVLQYNAISRSIHNLSATAKKLTAMMMALLPPDLSSLTASFTFNDFCKAIGYERGGKSYHIFIAAVDECMKSVITVETGKDARGRSNWEKLTWFTYSKFNKDSGVCTMTFSAELAAFIVELKRLYAKINLQDLGRLQSKYALRLFELAKSYESLAGKDGNQEKEWYFERNIDELRAILGIDAETYKKTGDFRKYVVEKPVEEINHAGVGLAIESKSVKQGRKLVAIRLNCKKAARESPVKRGRPRKNSINQQELPECSPKIAGNRTEKELEHLKECYPDEFAVLYAAELEKPSFMGPESEIRKRAARSAAMEILKARYGIVK
jgi:plasmid replication initiation protein